MKKLYLYFAALLSTGVSSQSILNQAETGSRTVSDPQVVVLAPGFNAKSSISNPFIAKIGAPSETPPDPANTDAGSSNPSGPAGNTSLKFHDTQGNIDVSGGGQLQYALPITLPPGVKSVAPKINLVYTSGSGNGIAGFGWSISGITAISRIGRNIEKDGELRGVKLDYSDYYSFNGQRLILKSGEYGKDGAEYVTEKYSNIIIKSVGENVNWKCPQYWEVTFEDGSQGWYGNFANANNEARNRMEFNIVKFRDAQGNIINYTYYQEDNVITVKSITWGGNETLSKTNFNEIIFNYITRDLVESAFVNGAGTAFIQTKLLNDITVKSNGSQFKKYVIGYFKNGTSYQFLNKITEYNADNEAANPVTFDYPPLIPSSVEEVYTSNNDPFSGVKLTGDFNGDSYLDFVMSNGSVKLGAFNDNFTTVTTNKYFNADALVVNTLLDEEGQVYNGNGIIQYESGKIVGYIFRDNIFVKVFDKLVYDSSDCILTAGGGSLGCHIVATLNEGDIDGDGISNAFLSLSRYDRVCIGSIKTEEGKGTIPDCDFEDIITKIGNFVIDLKNQNLPFATYTNDTGITDALYDNQKYLDVNGDGKVDIINVTNNAYTVYEFVKTGTNQYQKKIRFTKNLTETKQPEFPVLFGDFNGDGKLDFTIPVTDTAIGKPDNWRFYIGTGNGFNDYLKTEFLTYRKRQTDTSGGYNLFAKQYFFAIADMNKDGKSDVIQIFSYNQINYFNTQYRKFGYVISSKIANGTSMDGSVDFTSNLSYSSPEYSVKDVEDLTLFTPLTNPIKSNNNYYNVFVYWKQYLKKVKAPTSLAELSRIQSITQAQLTTSIEYKELIPSNSNFYSAPTKQIYPYVSFQRMDNTFLVSKIISGDNKKQDYKYRDFTFHLQGRGMLGFRQTARSSWYIDGKENTVIWSGAEIDPLNESVPIKEWSVRTYNDNNLIFPADISENNAQLLSYKKTEYQTNILTNGVKAIVPWKSKNKDFLKDVTIDSEISYGDYYLPSQTNTSVKGGFSISQTVMTYVHNPLGSGKDYYIGRPESKIESVTAYGDTKSTEEYYEYENNLLSFVSKSPTSASGSILEGYLYDGWGNVIEKSTAYRDPKPRLSKTEKAQYDDKGRFVIKKTDNLGLETNITYNDWGQIEIQTDPLGIVVTNTYDRWGKPLTSVTNMGGVKMHTKFTYEKLSDGGSVVTQYEPDGNTFAKYTNKLGQVYKTRTKAFGQNNYVAKYKIYDGLGRTLQESEPYFDLAGGTQSPGSGAKWSTITYDDTVFPTKTTATSFNGKQMETYVFGRTTSVKELNGNHRFNTKTTDALGNVITATDKGGTITFSYNATGQQLSAQYGTNIVTTKYDIWGRKTEFNDPSNGMYTYSYDGFGRILKETSPKGYKQYTYNNLGQLTTQKEMSADGTSTVKNIAYSYNTNGMMIGKSGTVNGKAYSSTVSYDNYGRLISSLENNNSRYFMKKGITYDDKMRVSSYEKSLYSAGQYTKVIIENVYDSSSGTMYQVKDKTQNKVLWELQSSEADGRILSAKLGGTVITNTYDNANFIATTTQNKSSNSTTFLKMSYTFDALKNELNYRKREGGLGIEEYFEYDDNNRLVNWTDPVTGTFTKNAIRNTYDIQGRITDNDQVGQIKFNNNNKIYQATGMVLNITGQQNFNEKLLQKITYNENNDPIFIDGMKGDARFEYGLSEMRQVMTYGGNFDKNGSGKFTKYYSEDGSYEIVKNNQTGQEKHILYIGGSPYDSNIVYLKNYAESTGSYKFLHKDYLGSILAITDEAGNAVEQRHYDAWGNFTHLKIGTQPIIAGTQQVTDYLVNNDLLIDRGYTSHEHLSEVGLIHMNGRLYDPLLRRFLNADENIQDMFNTQNYNKYGYVLNNPTMYADPSGEFIWFAVGALIGAYMTGVQANGSWNPTKWNWGQTWGKIAMGAAIGAVGGVVGAQAGLAAMTASGFTGGVIGGAIAGSVGGAVGGAISGLGNSVMFGGNPITGTLTGALSGAVMGGVVGGVAGGIGTLWNNSRVTDPLLRNNIWTNERVVAGRSPWAFNNVEKPTTAIGKVKILQVGELEGELIKDSPKLNLKNCVDCENPRFIFDSKGKGLDLEYFNNLTENSNSSIISGGKGGQNIVNMSGPPNSYTNLNNGHIVVYGPEGKPIFDINAYRVKGVFYNTTPSGKVIPSFGNSTKFNGPTPKSLIDFFGL